MMRSRHYEPFGVREEQLGRSGGSAGSPWSVQCDPTQAKTIVTLMEMFPFSKRNHSPRLSNHFPTTLVTQRESSRRLLV